MGYCKSNLWLLVFVVFTSPKERINMNYHSLNLSCISLSLFFIFEAQNDTLLLHFDIIWTEIFLMNLSLGLLVFLDFFTIFFSNNFFMAFSAAFLLGLVV